MTFPQYRALQKVWEKHPPVHHLVAAYLGYSGQSRPVAGAASGKPGQLDPASMAEIMGGGPRGAWNPLYDPANILKLWEAEGEALAKTLEGQAANNG